MNEVYRAIPGHPNYEVSNLGNVRSITHEQTLRGKGGSVYTRTLQGRILKPGPHSMGYLQVNLSPKGTRLVHALVLLAFVGPGEDKAHINHRNGNKQDNRLENLEYCTAKRNSEHAVHSGLTPMPPGAGKLSAEQVLEINRRIQAGEQRVQIARDYNVSRTLISCIAKGRVWHWLTGNNEATAEPKLTPKDVEQIKTLLAEGQTGRAVARMFNVSPPVISLIKNGKR